MKMERTSEEILLEHFMKNTKVKAKELTGLSFEITKIRLDDTLNLQDDITYFIPLENSHSVGFFYLGISKEHLAKFSETVINKLKVDYQTARQTIKNEEILIEYCHDLYRFTNNPKDLHRKTENFFYDDDVPTDFIKFDEEVKRDCLYFELVNSFVNIKFTFKCMFYEYENTSDSENDSVLYEEIEKQKVIYPEEALLERMKNEEDGKFFEFFSDEINTIKKLFATGEEEYLVCYTKFDQVNESICTIKVKNFEEALSHIYYIYHPSESFDSVWINHEGEEVYSFGMQDPENYINEGDY